MSTNINRGTGSTIRIGGVSTDSKSTTANITTSKDKEDIKTAVITVNKTDSDVTITITYPRIPILDTATQAETTDLVLTNVLGQFIFMLKLIATRANKQLPKPKITFNDPKTESEFKRLFETTFYAKVMDDKTLSEMMFKLTQGHLPFSF